MKKFLLLLCIFIMSLSILGCGNELPQETKQTNSSEVSKIDKHKEKVEEEVKKIDFDYINKDAINYFKNSQTYPMVKDASFSVEEKNGKKIILMSTIVDDNIDERTLLSLADSMIRYYGTSTSLGTDLNGPTRDNYGEFFDLYDAFIVISPASDPKNKTYLMKSIPAGAHKNIKLTPNEDFNK